jgi:hypothetical protein
MFALRASEVGPGAPENRRFSSGSWDADVCRDVTCGPIREAQWVLVLREGFDVGFEMSGAASALPEMIDNMNHGGRDAAEQRNAARRHRVGHFRAHPGTRLGEGFRSGRRRGAAKIILDWTEL